MELLAGLMNGQVLQRNKKNVCESVLVARSEVAGDLTVCVSRKKNTYLPGWRNKKIGNVRAGDFECTLSGIPVGGPYMISIRVGENKAITFKDILVGDVWILGGQSNMEGLGLVKDATSPHPLVRNFYMDDHWGVAKEPIHQLGIAVDPIHLDLCGDVPMNRHPSLGAGPGIAFGRRMIERSGVPQGLICCAHGGASMDQCNPDLKDLSGKSLYSAMLRRVWKNGRRVAGVLWYQGCTDTTTEEFNATYTDKMIRMVSEMRKDLHSPDLPFVMAQIARMTNSPWTGVGENESALSPANTKGWNYIRDQQRLLPTRIRRLAAVSTIDLPLADFIHLSGRGQEILGRRMAEAAWTLMKGKNCQPAPISVKSVRSVLSLSLGGPVHNIEVTFDSVVGSLRSEGLASGFTLTNGEGEGKVFPQIFHVEINGNKAILQTSMVEAMDYGKISVYYGYSTNPYCNITDEAGRSIPAFGPILLDEKETFWRALTVRRTPLLPGRGQLHDVQCPDPNDSSLDWKLQSFPVPFWDLHLEIEKIREDRLICYHLPFQCDEPMKFLIGLGYDGPIRAWLDKKEILFDPNGTNPMIYDRTKIKADVSAGRHDLTFALSTNGGKAWGIGIKIYRRDIPASVRKKGRAFYKMPREILA
jgi:sialate O-acetylesterase